MINLPKSGIGATEEHAKLICNSYKKWTGRELIAVIDQQSLLESLFYSPTVVLAHGIEDNPILNFGNLAALQMWEMDWDSFTRMPSRLTAEPMERSARDEFMRTVSENGFIDNYTGIRISSTGRKFYIENATVWNLTNEQGEYCGQAAAFSQYRYC